MADFQPVDLPTSQFKPVEEPKPHQSGVVGDVLKTYTGDIGGAWDKLKSDFVAANPNPNFRNEGFWNQMKDQFHGLVGTGMIPVDAFNLVISPVTAAVHAGPVKAAAAGERALLGALPGGNKANIPSQERVEGDLMGDLSAVAPEKGVPLATGTAPIASRAPKIADLKSTAQRAYGVVDQSGMRVSPQAIQDLHNTVAADLKSKGFHPKLQPRTQVALDELEAIDKAGQPLSLKDVDILRRIVGHAAGSVEKSDRFMARIVRDHIDDFVDKLGPEQLTTEPGGAWYKDSDAIAALKEARSAWSRMSKGEVIEGAIEKARTNAQNYSASGLENSLRVQFRRIANNDRAMARFSKEEQEAIKQVAKGGPLVNALRRLGKFAPHGIISTGTGIGLGFAVGGEPGAIILPLVGEVSKMGATALTEKSAREASELVRRGSAVPKPPPSMAWQKRYPAFAIGNALRNRSDIEDALPQGQQ